MTLPTRLRPLYAGALALLCLPSLSACVRTGNDLNTNAAHSPDSAAADPMAEFRNPKPRQAYRITMTITGAPGPFDWMRPIAHFDVTNRECLSPPKDNPGGRSAPVPTAPTDFELTQTGEGVYSGVVYADLMLDRDYNGHGICHWEMTSVLVQMRATGANTDTLYTPDIAFERLTPGGNQTTYFNKRTYPGNNEPSDTLFANPGLHDRSRFGPSIKDSDLFTVQFDIADEAFP
jgi:hypothetical protein